MKREYMLVIITCLSLSLLLSSCSGGTMYQKLFGNKHISNEQAEANAKLDMVLEAIGNRDTAALKALFSKNAIDEAENFNQSMLDLFDYYQGVLVSYDDWGAINVSAGINDEGTGRNRKEYHSTYDVKTSTETYRIAIQDYVQDTSDPNNVGIWSLYIIKMEDDIDPSLAYRGDDKDTPGIQIGIQNVLPKEDDTIGVESVDD